MTDTLAAAVGSDPLSGPASARVTPADVAKVKAEVLK